jgi:hypothetical protein
VVAVVACLDTELVEIGSGCLITERLVLTARYTADERTSRPARSLRVIRRSGGAQAPAAPSAAASDVAVRVERSAAIPTGGDPDDGDG